MAEVLAKLGVNLGCQCRQELLVVKARIRDLAVVCCGQQLQELLYSVAANSGITWQLVLVG